THGLNMIPFFFFYPMVGFQRVGDMIWAAGDAQARGFLLGATAGRTTLAGEGLQHQDGQSHLLALANPTIEAYDPAYAYEIAVIVHEGLRRMLEDGENVIYYLTLMNEFYTMPPMPKGAEKGILNGLYKFQTSGKDGAETKVHLLGSGSILNEAVKARQMLEEDYGISADVWSVTSYKKLYWDACDTERWNLRHPDQAPRRSHLEETVAGEEGIFVAASDYVKALPAMVAKWFPGPLYVLGTDGFGRSESREALRDFFEVDARHIAFTALSALAAGKQIDAAVLRQASKDLGIDTEKPNPLFS
ncbi:MAG: pyruvate dehydrogenase (acetyl-transferring), homodimeric type, partial [Desulfosarcinaceae bacterium]